MASLTDVSSLYLGKMTKFELLQASTQLKDISVSNLIKLINTHRTINCYHSSLILRSLKDGKIGNSDVKDLIEALHNIMANVMTSQNMREQSQYLKVLLEALRFSHYQDNAILKSISEWYCCRPDFVLEKTFLKIFRHFTPFSSVDIFISFLDHTKSRSYNTVLFGSPNFLTEQTDKPTHYHQSLVLEIVIRNLTCFLGVQPSEELITLLDQYIPSASRYQGYILSIVTGDDYQFLSCLTAACHLYSTCQSSSLQHLSFYPDS
eukprot:sb/3468397/